MSETAVLPRIVQGGMGVGVSDWRLARAVSSLGQLGVVSGTALDNVLVRRLQLGDPGGHVRRALLRFPIPDVAAEVIRRYFVPGGKKPEHPFRTLPMYRHTVSAARERITMLATFAEVLLAKEGHGGLVGMNLLTKVQLPTLASLYGAILAGVDFVLMGAGIPREIPAALSALAEHRPASLRLEVEGVGDTEHLMTLDPREHLPEPPQALRRPRFLPIVSSHLLATVLVRKTPGVDGLVIEGPTAGGHNAPPRGEARFNERGEPLYGDRDEVDLEKVAALGVPFWIAGGAGSPEALRRALDAGARGVQVGTLFAYCEESGLAPEWKRAVLAATARGDVDVRTDPLASPTGYPFKVVDWDDNPARNVVRPRVCDLGYLRVAFRDEQGRIDYRCASEPSDAYVRKGGSPEETKGRQCLCNALLANIGLAQVRSEGVEPPLLTSGDDLVAMGTFLRGRSQYTAAEVIEYVLGEDAAKG